MGTARKNCIWYDQCGPEGCGRCNDYTPADGSEEEEAFYRRVLLENAAEYEKMIRDYADGGEEIGT